MNARENNIAAAAKIAAEYVRATPKSSVITAAIDTAIEKRIGVRYISRVSAYGTANANIHSGFVNACTRSDTFHRGP